MTVHKNFENYLLVLCGVVGVITGALLTIVVPSIQGKWDMISFAGMVLTVLFALIASVNLKLYHESLEKKHEELTQKLRDEYQKKTEEVTQQFGETSTRDRNNLNECYVAFTARVNEENRRFRQELSEELQAQLLTQVTRPGGPNPNKRER